MSKLEEFLLWVGILTVLALTFVVPLISALATLVFFAMMVSIGVDMFQFLCYSLGTLFLSLFIGITIGYRIGLYK